MGKTIESYQDNGKEVPRYARGNKKAQKSQQPYHLIVNGPREEAQTKMLDKSL